MGSSSGASTGGAPEEFRRLVKRYREQRNMSQEHLAEQVGYSRTGGMVTQIENGERGGRLSRDRIVAFAQALQAPTAELLRAAGYEVGDEERPSFEEFIASDVLLRADQKRVLSDLYKSYVGRSGG